MSEYKDKARLERALWKQLTDIMENGREVLNQKTGELVTLKPTAADINAAAKLIDRISDAAPEESDMERAIRIAQEGGHLTAQDLAGDPDE